MGFQNGHFTEHAIAQLADQIHESFENDSYKLGVFIDTMDHGNLLKKLENYEIKGTNLAWFRSYLKNGKQYIQVTNDSKSDLRKTECGLVYVNDLPFSSKILNSIIFADDTNLFYEHKNIVKLLVTVNEESMDINDWFIANKLSLFLSECWENEIFIIP